MIDAVFIVVVNRHPDLDDQTIFWQIIRKVEHPRVVPLPKCKHLQLSNTATTTAATTTTDSLPKSSTSYSHHNTVIHSCMLDSCMFSSGMISRALEMFTFGKDYNSRIDEVIFKKLRNVIFSYLL